jgi:uncharacterized protein
MTIALVAVAAAAAACLQSTAGLGFALVLTPVLLTVVSPTAAILTATLLGLELNLLVLAAERRAPAVEWREVLPVLAAAVPGTAAGVLVLRALPRPALQIGVGALVLVAMVVRSRRAAPVVVPRGPSTTAPGLAVGLTAGVLTTSSGISGPPLALWFAHRGLHPAQLRDSLTASFLILGVAAAVALAPLLHSARLGAGYVVAGFFAVLAGHQVGSRIFHRLRPHHFEPLLLGVVSATALLSIVAGLRAF